jgi:hypothetical protein
LKLPTTEREESRIGQEVHTTPVTQQ